MSRVIQSDDENQIYVVGVDMENRSMEDIARDAAMQINGIFERLLKSFF